MLRCTLRLSCCWSISLSDWSECSAAPSCRISSFSLESSGTSCSGLGLGVGVGVGVGLGVGVGVGLELGLGLGLGLGPGLLSLTCEMRVMRTPVALVSRSRNASPFGALGYGQG